MSCRDTHILVDCGLYQGTKNYRQRNWQQLPVAEDQISAIVLTHAHIDHSGYIPALVKRGFRGPVYCSEGTLALCEILLPDAGYLQEEDARYANKHRVSKHHPALPLFTEQDARRALRVFRPAIYHESVALGDGMTLQFSPAGHIIGACSARITAAGRSVVFSGDIGRPNDPVMCAPAPLDKTDYLIVESTYGDRRHAPVDPMASLKAVINRTVKRGGVVLIPAFAVGRAQMILYLLQELMATEAIPRVPVHLNSPMALAATEVFNRFHSEHKLSAQDCRQIVDNTHFVGSVEESKALVNQVYPSIIISASGMASGGRVIHHLKALVGDHRNSVVFVGFQAPGTRGDALVKGADAVKMHGHYYDVNAEIVDIEGLSAHADYREIIDWLQPLREEPPRHTFVTHGEKAAADSLRLHLQDQLGWSASVPEYLDSVVLD
ncbi:MBL fold metallo-hydrolase RNA specificity domain-containing protein [Exilibacterium tricleocarpae]|uniref:MBL fold metallo-hydrolase RNA specificity domain-containing protein n=1 Tax=Exilibacterium tricleocarpae TaxID=2591008 RepID=UPI00248280F8|nr:MBL fold metallo-hydrolase [Exilibacterium tricleocarpae]